jgi:S1-C subfamily serine protease
MRPRLSPSPPSSPGLAARAARALLPVGLVVLLLPATAPAQGPPAVVPVPKAVGEPWNDRAVRRALEAEGARLLDAGRTGPSLADGLDRKGCALALPGPRQGRRDLVSLLAEVERSVVVVGRFYRCSKCTNRHMGLASGFFVSDTGAMVTSRHVLTGDPTLGMVVMTRDGRVLPVREVLAADEANDVVIAQVEGATGVTPLPLQAAAPPGTGVIVMGHPDEDFYTVTTGIVSRYLVQPGRSRASFLAITADFAKGSSGGPVFTLDGNVVGVVNSTRTLYATQDGDAKADPQTVVKQCTPARALLDLVRPPAGG